MSESQETKKKEEQDSESSGEDNSLYSQESIYEMRAEGADGAFAQMGEADLHRYEAFRRSNLPKGLIKKFISNSIGQAVNPNIIITVAGISKVFVGEMVGEAKKVQREKGGSGALLPSHIHEAFRRLSKRTPCMRVFKREPWNR